MIKIFIKSLAIFVFSSSLVLADDYGSAGKFIIKGKVQGIMPGIKSSKSSDIAQFYPMLNNNQNYPINVTTAAGNVLGVSASASYFLSDHIAIEASVGFYNQKIKVSGQGPQFVNGAIVSDASFHQSTKAGIVPFAAAVQYHIAPYGKLSPYIGAGYHSSFATVSSGSSISSSRGPLFQAGIDGWINSNVLFNIEVKKTFMNPRVSFINYFATDSSNAPISQNVPTSTRVKLDPLIISAGIGVRL